MIVLITQKLFTKIFSEPCMAIPKKKLNKILLKLFRHQNLIDVKLKALVIGNGIVNAEMSSKFLLHMLIKYHKLLLILLRNMALFGVESSITMIRCTLHIGLNYYKTFKYTQHLIFHKQHHLWVLSLSPHHPLHYPLMHWQLANDKKSYLVQYQLHLHPQFDT